MDQDKKINHSKIEISSFQIRADVQAESFNEEEGTVDLVWSTGAKGLRSSWSAGTFYEELSMDPSAVRLGRLQNGAPLLNSHSSYDLRDVIGVVESANVENAKGTAKVRFSNREDVKTIKQDVKDGILRKVSVGYRVHRYENVTGPDDTVKTFRAVDWEPYEISIVPMAFDDNCSVRSADAEKEKRFECELISRTDNLEGENQMEVITKTESVEREVPSLNKEEIVKAERARVSEIQDLCAKAGLEGEFARKLVDNGTEVNEARKLVIDAWAAKSDSKEIKRTVTVERGELDERETAMRGMEEGLLHRSNPEMFREVSEVARPYVYRSLSDLAADYLESRGQKIKGLHKMEIAKRSMNAASDFPNVLANVLNKVLRKAYEQAPATWKPWTSVGYSSDFKQVSRVQLDAAPQLLAVPEGGEFKYGTVGESKEVYQLGTYGKIISVTRQLIVNDDLDAFSRLPKFYARAAAQLETLLVYTVLNSNPTMGDSIALFHSSHGNLGSGGAISVTTLGEMRQKMRQQKGLTTEDFLNLQAKFLIVPPELETLAQQFMAQNTPQAATNVNPFSGAYQLIVEPNLTTSTTAWFGAADPSQVDTVEVLYLEGQPGLQTEMEMGFDIDGMKLKARLDVAAKALDYKGLFKNAGV